PLGRRRKQGVGGLAHVRSSLRADADEPGASRSPTLSHVSGPSCRIAGSRVTIDPCAATASFMGTATRCLLLADFYQPTDAPGRNPGRLSCRGRTGALREGTR